MLHCCQRVLTELLDAFLHAGISVGDTSIAFLFLKSVICDRSLTLREEHRLRMFENRMLRRIFGPTRDGVTGDWRKLHNEEFNSLYCSPNIVRVIKSRRMGWEGHVARME